MDLYSPKLLLRFWRANQQWLLPFLKVVILIAMLVALYMQVIHQHSVQDLQELINGVRSSPLAGLIWVVLLCMPLNWTLEAAKWRMLIRGVQPISLLHALRAVLGGVMLGLFTPNRIGEFGGRVMFLESGKRIQAVPFSLVGSLAQILVTLIAGLLGLSRYLLSDTLRHGSTYLIVLTVLLLVLFCVYQYLPLIAQRASTISVLPNSIADLLLKLREVSRGALFRALAYSAARYAVFAAQYLVLLRVFGVQASSIDLLTALALVFLAQSVLPTFAVVEVLRRGNIALFFFGLYGVGEVQVLAASTLLWLINLILPAVFGYILMLGSISKPPDGS